MKRLLTHVIAAWTAILIIWFTPPAWAQDRTKAAEQNQTATRSKPTAGQDAFVSELARIEDEIGRVKAGLKALTAVAGAPDLKEVRESLGALSLSRRMQGICVDGKPTGAPIPPELASIVDAAEAYSQASFRSYVWEDMSLQNLDEICRRGVSNLLTEIGSGIDRLMREFGDLEGRKSALQDELKTLQERRSDVLAEMSEGAAAARVAKNIPLLMGIIFGVGAIVLAGVKLFSNDIQEEMVVSGQIVQFVTILILLGIVLALGLADRLKEEALGTLLGGLAGYVLSQGVGRQERNRVLRAVRAVVPQAQAPEMPNNRAPSPS